MSFSFLNSDPRKKRNLIDPFGIYANNPAYNQSRQLSQSQQTNQSRQSQQPNQSRATNQSRQSSQSQQPNQSRVIQGSGYGSNYANNPQTARRTQQRPQVQQPQQQPQQQGYSPSGIIDNLINTQGQIAQNRIGGIRQRSGEQESLQAELANARQQTLNDIAGMSSDAFNQYADQVRGQMGLTQDIAQRQIGDLQTGYQQQRGENERARQERMRGLQNTLAGLNTLESSAFGNLGASINMGAERMDRAAQRELNSQVANIQDSVMQAQMQAESAIQQEGNRYLQQLRQIQGSMDENSIEYKQAVSAIRADAEQRIDDILGGLSELEYNAGMQLAQLQGQGQDQLSDGFLQTGQPQTRADMIWMAENPDEAANLRGMIGLPEQMSPQEQQERQRSIDIVDTLLNSDLVPLSDLYGRTGLGTFAGEGANTKALVNQLISRLSVDERGKLKGQGQITEGEQAMLRQSLAALEQPGITEPFIRQELQIIKDVLQGNYSGRSTQPGRPGWETFVES